MSLHLIAGIVLLILGAIAFETAGERAASHYFRSATWEALLGIAFLTVAAICLSA